MCLTIARAKAIKAAARDYADDHDWHPCISQIENHFRYSYEEALVWLPECRSEMRRLGKRPESRCTCPPSGPFRS